MPTYYVRSDGNDVNLGTNPNTSGAWKTLTKALGGSGITAGDTLFIAPGVYRETITLGFASSGSTTYIIGDPQALNFAGVSPGTVRLTAYTLYDSLASALTPSNTSLISGTGKSNISFEKLYLEFNSTGIAISSCNGISVTKSIFSAHKVLLSTNAINITQDTTSIPHYFAENFVLSGNLIKFQPITSGATLGGFINVRNVLSLCQRWFDNTIPYTLSSPVTFTNCTLMCFDIYAISSYAFGAGMLIVKNTMLFNQDYANVLWNGGNHISYFNCRFSGPSQHYNSVPNQLVNCTYGTRGIDLAENLLFGLSHAQLFSSSQNGVLVGVGTAAGIATSDMYGYPWQLALPDIGSAQFRNLNTISNFNPGYLNFDSTDIFANSTQKSIYFDIGATGVTYNTPALNFFYIRDKSTTVPVALTAQSPSGTWISGGICEVDRANLPGFYRVDIPDASIISGADKVIFALKGAGLNGYYVSLNLTENISNASIASTVWNTTNKIITGGAVSSVVNAVNITTNAMSGIANSVWTNTSRTITQSFPANFANLSISAAGKVSIVQSDLDYITSNIPEVNYTNIASANWNYLMSGIATSGTFGYQIKVFLDATVSSRSTLTSNQVLEAIKKSTMTTAETNKEIFSKLP